MKAVRRLAGVTAALVVSAGGALFATTPAQAAEALRFATEGTVVVWWDGRLPNTERGNEEVFHSARFKVGTGGVTGTWSDWKRSKVSSIAK